MLTLIGFGFNWWFDIRHQLFQLLDSGSRSHSGYRRITAVQMWPSLSSQKELFCYFSRVRPNHPQVRPVSEHCGWHHHYCMAHLSRWELQCSLHKAVEVKVFSVQWCSWRAENREMFISRRASDLLGVVQSAVWLPAWLSVLLLFIYWLSINHYCVSLRVFSKPGHWSGPPSSRGSQVKLSTSGARPCWRAGSGGSVLWAGTDGGQCLLAAVQEGRIVGALTVAVVVVRLPSLTLPFPLTAEDPNKGLSREKRNKYMNCWVFPKPAGCLVQVTCLNSRL